MSPVLKWIVIILVVTLVVSADILLVLKMEWPWWAFAVVLLCVLAAIFIVVWTIRGVSALLRRSAEKKALAQANGSAALYGETQDRRRRMQSEWAAVVKKLRGAKLRGKGNPITSYPWYLVIGAPGSGKSTMMRNSRHAMHMSEVVPGIAKSATPDGGDWYVCDDAIVIDAPGYFTVPRTVVDNQVWDAFLRLIRKTRKLPALNGLIVCVSAADLYRTPQQIADLGSTLRQRTNELMRVLGVRCPVYLQITQCDRIHGMAKFFQCFPDATFNQAIGALNPQTGDGGSVAQFVELAFAQLREDLSRLRMVILGSRYAPEVETQALLFPEEFMALKGAIIALAKPAFDAGAQQDSPYLRGVYFSSAHQEGVPTSAYMERLGFGAERQALATTNLSLFLRDFFARVLPQDRNLVAPTRMAVTLVRFTQNAGLTVWALAMVAAGALLGMSFVKNLTLTRTAFGALPASTKMSKDFSQDLQTLATFRSAVVPLVESNRTGLLPRLGLSQSLKAQTQLQRIYSARFRSALLAPADLAMDRALTTLDAQSPPERTAAYVDLIAKRMKLQQAGLSGQLGLAGVPQPAAPDFQTLSAAYPALASADQARDLGATYASYIEWQPDATIIEQDLAADKQRIRTVLTREGIGLRWLTDWANLQSGLPEIAYRDYWGPELDAFKNVNLRLGRAFTPEGAEAIKQFLADIESANQNDEVFALRRAEYLGTYRNQYFKAWSDFLASFHQGASAFTGREARIQLAGRIAAKDSPYRRVLEDAETALTAALELAEKPEQIPDWVNVLGRFQRLNDPEYQKQLGGAPGTFDKLIGKAGKVGKAVKFALKNQNDEQKQLELDQKALVHVLSYYDSLKKTAESVNAPQAAFQLAKDVAIEFEAVIGEPKQAVTKNYWDQSKLKEYLGRGTSSELMFWQLMARPAEQVWSVLLGEAETHVQKAWAADVIGQGLGLAGWELVDALQGFSGKVWEFQKANLDPFLRNSPGKGYESRVIFASSLRFAPAFLNLLNRGRVGKDALSKTYAVQIGALPTDTNSDAVRRPHETRLVVQCAAGNQELVNYNFPVKKIIQWAPQGCGDVTIEVYVGDIVLKKTYPSYKGFIYFLNDLDSGRKVLQASNFPEQAGVLAGYRIRTVTLAYTFSGSDGVQRLAAADPSSVPERIVGSGE